MKLSALQAGFNLDHIALESPNPNVLSNFKKIIDSIFEFELRWLKYKQKLQIKKKIKLKNDNLERIKVLKKRFK